MGGIIKCKFKRAYVQQRSNANQRGIEFKLTFDEWLHIWLESGKLEQRGRGAAKYCMCRIGDVGAYEVGNVFIDLNKRNVSDGNKGKTDSLDTKAKKSAALKGQPHPWVSGKSNPMHRPDVKSKISAAIGGANHYRQRGVNTPHGYFVTAKAASEALGIPKGTVEWRARNNKFGFSQPDIA